MDVGNLISGSSAFSKTSLTSGSSQVLKPGLENFKRYFASLWDKCHCVVVWTFSGIAFLLDWMKTDLFQCCGKLLSFPNLLVYLVKHFTASSFRIWNSSTGIPSAPLALLIMMLPKAHLTLYSRTSDSRWVITSSWFYGSWRFFLYSSSVYSCQLFLMSSASVRPIPFLSFIVPIFWMKCSFGISNFLEEISISFPSFCFSLFLCIDHWVRLSYLSLLFFGTLPSNRITCLDSFLGSCLNHWLGLLQTIRSDVRVPGWKNLWSLVKIGFNCLPE